MKFLTSISEILTPRPQHDHGSWVVSLLLAASVLFSVFALPATGAIDPDFIPVRDPNAEVAPIVTDIGLASAIRKQLDITDKSQALTVADLEKLTELNTSNLGISSLAGLEHATNLTELYLHRNAITDLTPLTGLTNLTRLHLYDNRISDLTPLKGLTNLTHLWLGEWNRNSNRISDLTPLKGLTNLTSLALGGNQISDLTPLKSLTNLISLHLTHNKIRDISPLASLTRLTQLSIDYNPIANIDPIKPIIESGTLVHLGFEGTAITEIDMQYILSEGDIGYSTALFLDMSSLPLAALDISTEAVIPNDTLRAALQEQEGAPEVLTQKFISTLTSLDLSRKDIGNFTGLEAAINLTSLTLNDTKMTPRRLSKLAEVLGQLPKLRELHLGNSKITNVSALAGLTQLTKLRLYQNDITDVSSLKSLTSLTDLDLSDNRIANIEGLRTLAGLQRLDLHGNHRLVDVAPLSGLTSLTHLFLSRNRIADVAPLSGLTNLQALTLDHNRIADFAPISSLTDNLSDYKKGNQKADPAVKIPDTNLRSAVLTALGRDADTDTAPIRVSEMATLTTLRAQNAGIADLTGLQHAVNLKTLDLSGNALDDDDVSRLLRLTQLESLILTGNDNITNLKPFRKLGNLTSLTLPNGIATEDPIVDIPDSGLRTAILRALGKSEAPETQITGSDMDDLRTLQASGFGVRDLTGLELATNLRKLYLNNNQISDLSPISGLNSLERLSLNNNNISDVGNLSGLTDLRWLRLNNNRISAVAPLNGLTNLETLVLSNNRFSDASPLTALTALENLRLDGNPIDVDSLPTSLKALVDTPSVSASTFNLLDVNRDGSVNRDDKDIVSRLMGIPSGDLAAIERATQVYPDVDGDGDVDEVDVAAVTAAIPGEPRDGGGSSYN